jgi:hypothetical protein
LKLWRSLGETTDAHRNTYKTGTSQLVCFASATTKSYHPQGQAARPSSFRHTGNAHALIEALAQGKESRMVARRINSIAADGEGWIERQACLCGGPRLIQFAEQCKGSSEDEVR